jgi:hypothetical protein
MPELNFRKKIIDVSKILKAGNIESSPFLGR